MHRVAAPPKTLSLAPRSLPRSAGVLAVLALAALFAAVVGRTLAYNDFGWALVWGSEIAGGSLPTYEVGYAPTPHPFATGVAALASVLGPDGAYTAMLAVVFLGFGGLVWGTVRLGQAAFSWPVGLAAGVVLVTSYEVLYHTASGVLDLPAAALVVGAAVLEARTPRRGAAVLALLAVAGLQRPEAWLFAGAYWLYLFPGLTWRQRITGGLLAAAAPLVWILADLIATGDPLFSFTRTEENVVASEAGIPALLRDIVRAPVLIGGAAGLALVLAVKRLRSVPTVALVVLGGLALALLQAAGLEIVHRFLFAVAAGVAVLFGVAALGWTRDQSRFKLAWAGAGVALLAATAVSMVPGHVNTLRSLPGEFQDRALAHDDLRDLTESTRAAAVLQSCPRVLAPQLLVPFLAYYLDRPPGTFAPVEHRDSMRPGPIAVVTPTGSEARHLIQNLAGGIVAVQGFRTAAENRSWRVLARGCA